jgi:hypothetical protein
MGPVKIFYTALREEYGTDVRKEGGSSDRFGLQPVGCEPLNETS